MTEPKVEPGGDDRRNDDRAAITLKVDYKRLNTFFADYTKNISKGGTFIRTTKPLDVGTEFVFVLTVPEPNSDSARSTESAGGSEGARGSESQVRLELAGEVKWVVPESQATASSPAGMGIQFVFKDPSEKTRVEKFVADLMTTSLGERLAQKLLSRTPSS